MRISDWSSDVCSSDLPGPGGSGQTYKALGTEPFWALQIENGKMTFQTPNGPTVIATAIQAGPSFNGWRYTSEPLRSEEHTSELQSLMLSSYAVFCLKKKMPPLSRPGQLWNIFERDGIQETEL